MDFDPGSWNSLPVPGSGEDRAKKGEGELIFSVLTHFRAPGIVLSFFILFYTK